MIFITNLNYVFQPKRLYFIRSEKQIPAMSEGEWSGDFESIPAPMQPEYFYVFTVERPWSASDAYAWFAFRLGARVEGDRVVNKPRFALYDAEDDRLWLEGILAGKHLWSGTFNAVTGAYEAASGTFDIAAWLMKHAKAIIIVAGVGAGLYYGLKIYQALPPLRKKAAVSGWSRKKSR